MTTYDLAVMMLALVGFWTVLLSGPFLLVVFLTSRFPRQSERVADWLWRD